MIQMIVWLKATIARLFGANEAPSLEIDIMEELNRIDEGVNVEDMESTELGSFSFEL